MVVVSNDVIIGVDIPFGVVIVGGIVLVDVDGLVAKIVFIISEFMIDLWIILYFYKSNMNTCCNFTLPIFLHVMNRVLCNVCSDGEWHVPFFHQLQ